MDVYDQLIDPTAVSHSLVCNLTGSASARDLVVVKNTLLQVFGVTADDKLVLRHEFPLQGQVLAIHAVKLKGSELDHLAVLTKFAKVSIVSFDLERCTLSTSSLHYYEAEFQKAHINEIGSAELRADPAHRALLCFHKDVFAFLPLNKEDDLEEDAQEDRDAPVFSPSIIVPSTKLDAEIHNVVDCAFLHNYREPTVAVLYNKTLTWSADLAQRKDTVSLCVVSLDLETGGSTPIINVDGLPYDLWRVMALPQGGCLLFGCNEIIHVDNSGNTKGMGVNVYYKDCTDFKLDDKSELDLFLEDCSATFNGDQVLFVDKTNTVRALTFERDGKVVKALGVHTVDCTLPTGLPSTLTVFDDKVFVGSLTTDALLLKAQISEDQMKKKKFETGEEEEKKSGDDDDDDDLYGDDNTAALSEALPLVFEVCDRLINHGSISSFTLGNLSPNESIQGASNPTLNEATIVATSGEGSGGKLTCFHPTIHPVIDTTLKFQNISKSWSLLGKYLVTTDLSNFKSEIFLINDNFKTFQTLDFKNNNITVNISTFASSQRIIQVTPTNVYLFDYTFRKILQLNTDFEILNARLLDPYIILTSSKGEIKMFELDAKGRKLAKIKLPEPIDDMILTFGTICNTRLLQTPKRSSDDEAVEVANPLFLVTTVDNQIFVFPKVHNDKVHQLSNIHNLPELSNVVPNEFMTGLDKDPFIKEVDIMAMGDAHHKEEVLTILTIGGETLLYRISTPTRLHRLPSNVFTGAPENMYAQATVIERKLIPFTLHDTSYLFITGKQPYVVIKSRHSHPKIFKFTHTSLVSICEYEGKFMAIDAEKNARICSFPQWDFSCKMPVETVHIGKTINNITFHISTNLLVLSTLSQIPYDAKDEEGLPIVGSEEKTKAWNYKSGMTLLKPQGWHILDEVEFPDEVVINSLKSMELTVSSRSKKKKEFIVIGTGKYRLEDLTVLGEFQLYEPISIVPDPEKPEVDHKLKETVKEVVKGAVTTMCEISGRFLVSQGQKIIIRDLQQDNSTVPVAFLDTATYLSDAKSFGNLVVVGDTLKNIWFLGFDAEPYRVLVLGKSLSKLDVSCCDFLVSNGEVNFLVADDEGTLHLVAYDPDDAKSLSGQRLMEKTTMHINTLTTTMRMVPKHEEFKQGRSFQVIGANADGSLFKMTPIDEFSYRRFYILQQQLSDKLYHHCGLNPKANRYHFADAGVKPVIDFELIRRFAHLAVDKRRQYCGKVGKNAYAEIWRDIIEVENSLNVLTE